MLPINFDNRRQAVAAKIREYGYEAYIGSRMAALHYLGGVFMPWRGMVVVTKDGAVKFIYWEWDASRVRKEGPPLDLTIYNDTGLIDTVVRVLKELGISGGNIAADFTAAASSQIPPGALTATEYIELCRKLPNCQIKSGMQVLDDCMLIKDEAEIQRLRYATEVIADYGFRQGLAAVRAGASENHIAGVIEAAVRDKGSYWTWSITAGTEVGGGERSAFPGGVTTIATERTIKDNEFVILDLHPAYDLYYSDVCVPVFIGKPDEKQKKLIACWEEAVATVFDTIKPGSYIPDVVEAGIAVYRRYGLEQYCVPSFGHGLGVCARTGPVLRSHNKTELQSGMVMAMGAHLYWPGVGGMRLEYPVLIGKERAESLGSIPFRTHYI